MESCYVPNNPNFASAVDQWTPPSPTSPPVSVDAKLQQQQHQQHQQHQQQHHQHQSQVQQVTYSAQHDPVIQQLCESADLVHVEGSPSHGNDPSVHLTSLSALPPVQELLGPCRSPNSDVTGSGKDRVGDPFSGYSLTALDFEPLPGFLTLSSCTTAYKERQHQDMGDLPLGFKSPTGHAGYGSIYSNHPSPQHSHHQGPMSPFSAAVAAATQPQPSGVVMSAGSPNGTNQCQYSFPAGSGVSASKMSAHHHQTSASYQDNTYGSGGAGLFPSMSVNVSMNMTMGMGMSMGPAMSYGIDAGAPIQCWNTHNPSIHLPGVAAAAAAAAAASVNTTSTSYGIAPSGQLLSPIQVSYNSNIYPTSFTPSSTGYCISGDWRPEAPGVYELKDLKESSPSPFSSNGSAKNFGAKKQQNAQAYYQSNEAYAAISSTSPTAAAKKRPVQRETSNSGNSLSVDYDAEMASCGSGVSSSSGSENGSGQPKANLCRVCGKTYARPSTLKTHMRTHSGERPYRCGDCHKSFSQAANLTAHVRTHSGEKPFRCQICDRRFSQSSSVTTHMRTHSGERPYRCRMCKKAFSDSSTLTKHMRIHSGEKPYQCKLCLLRFSQSGNLNRHMRVHSAAS